MKKKKKSDPRTSKLASLENLLEMQILEPCPKPTGSEPRGLHSHVLQALLGDSDGPASSRTTGLISCQLIASAFSEHRASFPVDPFNPDTKDISKHRRLSQGALVRVGTSDRRRQIMKTGRKGTGQLDKRKSEEGQRRRTGGRGSVLPRD